MPGRCRVRIHENAESQDIYAPEPQRLDVRTEPAMDQRRAGQERRNRTDFMLDQTAEKD